jgi:hypothetical protein
MADPSAKNRTAESHKAVAAFSAEDMTDYTDAHPGGIRDTTDAMPISPTESNAATRTTGSTERGLASTTGTVGPTSLATLEAKPWPRAHLLGIPRELRDQIYKYAIVSDERIFIGPSNDGRNKRFENIPPLIRASRQLRLETHRMFLEQNTLEINERALMTNLSSKPFHAFKALCAGSELQKIYMDSEKSIGPPGETKVQIMADLLVVKTSDGLHISLPGLSVEDDGYEICSCRIERLASEYGGQEGAIVKFLEALRRD